MERLDGGWFELVTAQATVGTRYRYRLPDGTMVADPASRAQAADAGLGQIAWRRPCGSRRLSGNEPAEGRGGGQ